MSRTASPASLSRAFKSTASAQSSASATLAAAAAALSTSPEPKPEQSQAQEKGEEEEQQQFDEMGEGDEEAGVGSSSTSFAASRQNVGRRSNPPPESRKFLCEFDGCGAAFVQLAHLKIHMRRHTGEKPYVCQFCNKTFNQKGNLKTHERKHTGDKPFKCNFPDCNKTFAQLGNLRTHEKLHQNDKKHVCEQCPRAFAQLSTLKAHVIKVHERPSKVMSSSSSSNSLSISAPGAIDGIDMLTAASSPIPTGKKRRGRKPKPKPSPAVFPEAIFPSPSDDDDDDDDDDDFAGYSLHDDDDALFFEMDEPVAPIYMDAHVPTILVDVMDDGESGRGRSGVNGFRLHTPTQSQSMKASATSLLTPVSTSRSRGRRGRAGSMTSAGVPPAISKPSSHGVVKTGKTRRSSKQPPALSSSAHDRESFLLLQLSVQSTRRRSQRGSKTTDILLSASAPVYGNGGASANSDSGVFVMDGSNAGGIGGGSGAGGPGGADNADDDELDEEDDAEEGIDDEEEDNDDDELEDEDPEDEDSPEHTKSTSALSLSLLLAASNRLTALTPAEDSGAAEQLSQSAPTFEFKVDRKPDWSPLSPPSSNSSVLSVAATEQHSLPNPIPSISTSFGHTSHRPPGRLRQLSGKGMSELPPVSPGLSTMYLASRDLRNSQGGGAPEGEGDSMMLMQMDMEVTATPSSTPVTQNPPPPKFGTTWRRHRADSELSEDNRPHPRDLLFSPVSPAVAGLALSPSISLSPMVSPSPHMYSELCEVADAALLLSIRDTRPPSSTASSSWLGASLSARPSMDDVAAAAVLTAASSLRRPVGGPAGLPPLPPPAMSSSLPSSSSMHAVVGSEPSSSSSLLLTPTTTATATRMVMSRSPVFKVEPGGSSFSPSSSTSAANLVSAFGRQKELTIMSNFVGAVSARRTSTSNSGM